MSNLIPQNEQKLAIEYLIINERNMDSLIIDTGSIHDAFKATEATMRSTIGGNLDNDKSRWKDKINDQKSVRDWNKFKLNNKSFL